MRSFTVDEITQIVGGMLTKVASPEITHIAPPLLSDENTLALALGEEEIANLANSKAKAALVPLGVQLEGFTTIEVERPRLAMMKLLNLFYVPPVVNKDIHPSAPLSRPGCLPGENAGRSRPQDPARGPHSGSGSLLQSRRRSGLCSYSARRRLAQSGVDRQR